MIDILLQINSLELFTVVIILENRITNNSHILGLIHHWNLRSTRLTIYSGIFYISFNKLGFEV